MAIDDNTVYGLTGAQVKELPERINAVKGMAKVLTTNDYNYPADNPTSVGLWLLPEGFYAQQTGVNVRVNSITTASSSNASYFLVGKENAEGNIYITAFSSDGVHYYTVNHSSGSSVNEKTLYTIIRDYLTSTSPTSALSANQGRVLKELIDSIAIRGTGAPTTSTVGQVGTLYEDTTNGDLYICTDAANPYVWEEVGAGSGGGPTVVQTTGTSTTDVMSQNATTSMVFADPGTKEKVRIGNGTTSGNRAVHSVTIGHDASSAQEADIVIGYGARNGSTDKISGDNVLIGRQANATSNSSHGVIVGPSSSLVHSYGGVALGKSTSVEANYSVALGSYSKATEKGQVDISTSATTNTYGYNNSQYRLLTGVYDPQSAHDAATKGYVDTAVSGAGGASLTNTEFNTIFGTNLTGGA